MIRWHRASRWHRIRYLVALGILCLTAALVVLQPDHPGCRTVTDWTRLESLLALGAMSYAGAIVLTGGRFGAPDEEER